jgi:hypothetical protein
MCIIGPNSFAPIKSVIKFLEDGTDIHPDYIDYCKTKRPELNPYDTFESFTDYWVSVAGSKGVKLDWDATWRTWVRNQRATFKQPPKSNQFAGAI